MKNKNVAKVALLATALSSNVFAQEAPLSNEPKKEEEKQPNLFGTIDAVMGDSALDDYGRIIANYNLPKGWTGFTFLEFYKNNQGYYGKTYFSKTNKISPLIEVSHTNSPATGIGLGLRLNFTLKGFTYLSFDFEPLMNEGDKFIDRVIIGNNFGLNVPKMNISGFGRFDAKTKEWDYGELTIALQTKNFEFGYNPALINGGSAIPKIDHRIVGSVRYKF